MLLWLLRFSSSALMHISQLITNDVEVAAVGPVVPKVEHLEGSAAVHEEKRVELVRPWGWKWGFFDVVRNATVLITNGILLIIKDENTKDKMEGQI
ncbi:hypothetical protein U1Q18_021637 [Sarracenia purpurea var. burkii]